MIAVIFEVMPSVDGKSDYLDLANELKSKLIMIDGFISIERFQSINDPRRLLSLSFWKDEKAIKQWREMPCHLAAQIMGKDRLFENYRLRVASVIRDYSDEERLQAPNKIEPNGYCHK